MIFRRRVSRRLRLAARRSENGHEADDEADRQREGGERAAHEENPVGVGGRLGRVYHSGRAIVVPDCYRLPIAPGYNPRMSREQHLQRVLDCGIVAVVRFADPARWSRS